VRRLLFHFDPIEATKEQSMTNLVTRAGIAALGVTAAAALAGPTAAHASGYTAPACGNHSLAVTNTPSDGAMGHSRLVLLFRNKTHQACSLHGYPGVDALGGYGNTLAHAQRTLGGFGGATQVRTITVQPGHYASAVVDWANFNTHTNGDCTFSSAIAVTPANTSHTTDLQQSVSICSLEVDPTAAGTTGYDAFAAAQLQWIRGSSAISANQGLFWHRAKVDLAAEGSEYSYYMHQLQQLIALPDANQTPAQNHQYHHLLNSLNSFFATPGLYS
jgi:hypothetical protein